MRLTNYEPKDWKDLQNKTCQFLNEAGYFAESPKTINTVRGTVEVDVLATSDMELINQFICECKYWNTPVPKEKIHAFKSVVADSGSMVGIFISKTGYQSGAYEAAYCTNVLLKDWDGFIKLIEKQWIYLQTRKIKRLVFPLSVYTDPLDVPLEKLSKDELEVYKNLTKECLEAYFLIRDAGNKLYKMENVELNGHSFDAYDELFSYCDIFFNEVIFKYKELFKNKAIEDYKFQENDYIYLDLTSCNY